MSNESPASILFDELGNTIGVTFDGYVYRLQTQTTITDGYSNGPATVKLPEMAALSTDSALVVAISPNNPIVTSNARPSTSVITTVSASSSNVELLANNSTRLGATIFNNSSSLLYLKLGVSASLTSFTTRIFPLCYYEIPFGYTGEIDGFWIVANGNALVDELTL